MFAGVCVIELVTVDVHEDVTCCVPDTEGVETGVPDAEKGRFTQEFVPMAERQVRRDLIIDTIAERESLTASASAVDARIEELAKARNVDPGQVYAQLQKSGRLQEIERELTEGLVFGWLLEKNPVTTA